jgi:hypothetical protein
MNPFEAVRRNYLDVLSFVSVYAGLKCCPSVLILLVFEFVVISETPLCSLPLVKSLRLLDELLFKECI